MGPSFPLEEAAGDLPCGIGPLLVVHREGKEIDPLPWLFRRHPRHQDDRVAIPNQHGAVGLPGHTPGLETERLALYYLLDTIAHLRIPSLSMICLYRFAS